MFFKQPPEPCAVTRLLAIFSIALLGLTAAAQAEGYSAISKQSEFLEIVNDRTLVLTRPRIARPIALQVQRNGELTGEARGHNLTGSWSWEGDRFCRQMDWGGFNVRYSCQAVSQSGSTLKFVSDTGLFRTAYFEIR
ncbi:MAG: hypothetical protein ACI95S_002445 [Dinoroseobacter sp.]